jgi:hypothetical protein
MTVLTFINAILLGVAALAIAHRDWRTHRIIQRRIREVMRR